MSAIKFELDHIYGMARSLLEDYHRAEDTFRIAQGVKTRSYDKPDIVLSRLDSEAIDDIAEALQRCSERKFNTLGDAVAKIKAINLLMQDT